MSGILGRAVRIDGESRTVIGVMPARFEIPLPALKTRVRSEMWAPLAGDVSFWSRRDSRNLTVIGRLKPGLTPRLAEDEMNVLLRGLEREHPGLRCEECCQGGAFPRIRQRQCGASVDDPDGRCGYGASAGMHKRS